MIKVWHQKLQPLQLLLALLYLLKLFLKLTLLIQKVEQKKPVLLLKSRLSEEYLPLVVLVLWKDLSRL